MDLSAHRSNNYRPPYLIITKWPANIGCDDLLIDDSMRHNPSFYSLPFCMQLIIKGHQFGPAVTDRLSTPATKQYKRADICLIDFTRAISVAPIISHRAVKVRNGRQCNTNAPIAPILQSPNTNTNVHNSPYHTTTTWMSGKN